MAATAVRLSQDTIEPLGDKLLPNSGGQADSFELLLQSGCRAALVGSMVDGCGDQMLDRSPKNDGNVHQDSDRDATHAAL